MFDIDSNNNVTVFMLYLLACNFNWLPPSDKQWHVTRHIYILLWCRNLDIHEVFMWGLLIKNCGRICMITLGYCITTRNGKYRTGMKKIEVSCNMRQDNERPFTSLLCVFKYQHQQFCNTFRRYELMCFSRNDWRAICGVWAILGAEIDLNWESDKNVFMQC